jgi:hypothetical protein
MAESGEKSPWICHVCDKTGKGEAQACARCYMVTCPAHLQVKAVYNAGSGLYELQPVCLLCATEALH